jgi:hypothetical protein
MFELSLGFILAAIFIAAYLLISRLFDDETPELSGRQTSVTLNPVNTERSIGTGQAGQGLLPEQTERKKDVA